MAVFSDHLEHEVRLECMRPEQVEAAKARRPAIYVACGSIEWHGYHNPVGLDAVKAHEQLAGLAARAGGVVYPALFLGSGGGHMAWPSSFMVSAEPMAQILTELLHGFERDGYRQAILLSGHYPNAPLYMHPAVEAYRAAGGTMRVLALVENQVSGVGGDHAAKYETSAMLYLHPNLEDIERLHSGRQDDIGGPEEIINWMIDTPTEHPCYGLVGIDPRAHASADVGREHTERLLRFLEDWLNNSTD